jgi:hypothetical protein
MPHTAEDCSLPIHRGAAKALKEVLEEKEQIANVQVA